MVPLKLNLTNFMCYRGTTSIDFRGIHLAVLAGDNGQGKSALLDAMTWVLWGKARSSADQLVTHGESEMTVSLDFAVSGQRYTVTRSRSTKGRGSSSLELVMRRENRGATSMTGNGIRDTETQIRDVLRLDYDTFVNSAFLRQGQADEFTTKPPAKRKQILADILGLAEYDRYADEARGRARALDTERDRLSHELGRIQQEVDKIPQFEEELINAETESKATLARLREATDVLQELQSERRALDAKAETLGQEEQRVKESRDQIAAISGRLSVEQAKLAQFEALLERAEEIESLRERWEDARAAQERWNDLLRQNSSLQEQSAKLQREVDLAQSALQSDLKVARADADKQRVRLKRFSKQEAELAEAQHQLDRLRVVQAQEEEAQRKLLEWTEVSARLNAENMQLKRDMDELVERIDLLKTTDAATCPVCRQPLSKAHQATALQDANREGKSMGDLHRANQKAMREAQEARQQVEEEVRRYRQEMTARETWQKVMARATQAAEEKRETEEALQEVEVQASELRTRLDAGDFAQEAQQALAELASASESLGYDRAAHDAVREQIQELGVHQKEWEALHRAQQQRATVVTLVETWQQQIATHEAMIATKMARIAELREALNQQEAVRQRTREQQVQVNQLQAALNVANRQEGVARQKLNYAEQQAAEQPAVEAALHKAVEERTIYQYLANAFGKRGVQAMLIESAIPEIEQAANELLNRMTEGRMSVSLSTQREAKSSDDMIETLDILIADEQGERAYETFSGGEAFRINFALRIALSQLLAHRAGTSLKTLVIDEGFGSQDAQGRDRLVEAITSVQEDFERILVITHIDELKDAFPTRIDITKMAEGTQVVVG